MHMTTGIARYMRMMEWKTLTNAPLWRTGDKGAPPLPQTLAVRKQLQRKTYFAAHPDKKPKEQRIADWKAKGGDGGKGQGKGQGKGGGKGYIGGPGPDRRLRSIEEVAEDMLRTLEELKAQQRGGQSLSGSQQEGAVAGHV